MSRCPLCGGPLTAETMLEACEELIEERLGVLAARCPHCQGYLEAMPLPGRMDVGYLDMGGRFEVVLTLPCDDMAIDRSAGTDALIVRVSGRELRFVASG